ncbi:tRNA pseudouridine synthase B [Novosphingobium nitrogenifigens DSM 19370]|uniref:tRNA pseudouridine synthase B n=1 Tax=Novosphingobium nitrogenifigens DSM 19370 TaxID=983920 RepID=F1ZAL0_9SPHN|nr:tRNA pseudouridine(55) synthase TruB [Novosphingobium nitrogenifigens]EGD58353.1 tRNA pseudouridine synthase B [Novosphingobium nitrogenifigens DSM 19370]
MVDGWIILDKPLGLGSTQGVAAVKRVLRQCGYGKVKVGHGGTLDPLATGVLPIAIGEATKLAGRMLDATKTYAFTVRFGRQTDTLDLEGKVIATSDVQPTPGAVAAVVAERFTGPIEQVPPAYSAILIDGRRAYDRAREGEEVEMKSRQVTILRWDAIEEGEEGGECFATLTVTVSKGTYIRSLARDIALALGTRGHVTMLRRLKAGPFGIAQAISLDKLNETANGGDLVNVILPLEAGLVDIPALDLNPEQARAVRQGRVLSGLPQTDGLWLARSGTVPVALVELSGGTMKVSRGFNLPDVAE